MERPDDAIRLVKLLAPVMTCEECMELGLFLIKVVDRLSAEEIENLEEIDYE